jgi:hypothetical protein
MATVAGEADELLDRAEWVPGDSDKEAVQLESAQFTEALPIQVSIAASAWRLKPDNAKSVIAAAKRRRAIPDAIRVVRRESSLNNAAFGSERSMRRYVFTDQGTVVRHG